MPKIISNGQVINFSSGVSDLLSDSLPLKPITEAAYDLLTEDQKNSETAWLVTDAEDNGATHPNENYCEVYSEEETVIGTWFGKPLYRKAFTGTTGESGVAKQVSNISELMVSSVTNIYGVLYGENGYTVALNSCGKDWYVLVSYHNNLISIIATTSNYANSPYICVVEYTKTTD